MDWLTETFKIGLADAVATTFDDNIYLTAFLMLIVLFALNTLQLVSLLDSQHWF